MVGEEQNLAKDLEALRKDFLLIVETEIERQNELLKSRGNQYGDRSAATKAAEASLQQLLEGFESNYRKVLEIAGWEHKQASTPLSAAHNHIFLQFGQVRDYFTPGMRREEPWAIIGSIFGSFFAIIEYCHSWGRDDYGVYAHLESEMEQFSEPVQELKEKLHLRWKLPHSTRRMVEIARHLDQHIERGYVSGLVRKFLKLWTHERKLREDDDVDIGTDFLTHLCLEYNFSNKKHLIGLFVQTCKQVYDLHLEAVNGFAKSKDWSEVVKQSTSYFRARLIPALDRLNREWPQSTASTYEEHVIEKARMYGHVFAAINLFYANGWLEPNDHFVFSSVLEKSVWTLHGMQSIPDMRQIERKIRILRVHVRRLKMDERWRDTLEGYLDALLRLFEGQFRYSAPPQSHSIPSKQELERFSYSINGEFFGAATVSGHRDRLEVGMTVGFVNGYESCVKIVESSTSPAEKNKRMLDHLEEKIRGIRDGDDARTIGLNKGEIWGRIFGIVELYYGNGYLMAKPDHARFCSLLKEIPRVYMSYRTQGVLPTRPSIGAILERMVQTLHKIEKWEAPEPTKREWYGHIQQIGGILRAGFELKDAPPSLFPNLQVPKY